jgi:hypothetical protein
MSAASKHRLSHVVGNGQPTHIGKARNVLRVFCRHAHVEPIVARSMRDGSVHRWSIVLPSR